MYIFHSGRRLAPRNLVVSLSKIFAYREPQFLSEEDFESHYRTLMLAIDNILALPEFALLNLPIQEMNITDY